MSDSFEILITALQRNDKNAVVKAIEQCDDINAVDEEGYCVWDYAWKRSDYIELLVNAGVPLSLCPDLLRSVVNTDFTESVRVLIRAGANVHDIDDYGNCLLHHAASGEPELVELLLEAGVDPQHTNNAGELPLHWAIFWRNADVVEILKNRMGAVRVFLADVSAWWRKLMGHDSNFGLYKLDDSDLDDSELVYE